MDEDDYSKAMDDLAVRFPKGVKVSTPFGDGTIGGYLRRGSRTQLIVRHKVTKDTPQHIRERSDRRGPVVVWAYSPQEVWVNGRHRDNGAGDPPAVPGVQPESVVLVGAEAEDCATIWLG